MTNEEIKIALNLEYGLQFSLMKEATTEESINMRYHRAFQVLDILHSVDFITLDEWGEKYNELITVRSNRLIEVRFNTVYEEK